MDKTKVVILQHLYCPGIRKAVLKEVTNCDTCQHTKRSNIKYGKLPSKESEEIPWNKLCVYLIGTYFVIRKGNKEYLHIKSITMIDHVIGWFEITQYYNKRAISIVNLVETTWLARYHRPI